MSFLITLFIVHLLAVMTPGPDFLIVTKMAMGASRRAGFLAALGVVGGVVVWTGVVLLGFHLLFEQLAWLQTATKIVGGAYLVYMGIMMLKASWGEAELPDNQEPHVMVSDFAAFRAGLATNLANPKVLIYFGSIFATFITPSTSIANKALIFLLIPLETLAWFWLLAVLFSLPAPRQAYRRANKWIDRVAGTAFGAFGLRLIFAGKH